jgi:hypothetical protein
MKRLLAALALLVLCIPAWGGEPCCGVVSVDPRSGIVTVREKSSARTFAVRIDNAILLQKVQAGQAVDADFGGMKAAIAGLPGRHAIVSPPTGAGATAQRPPPSLAASPPKAPSPAAPPPVAVLPAKPAAPPPPPARGLPSPNPAPGPLAHASTPRAPASPPPTAPPARGSAAGVPAGGSRPDDACCRIKSVERGTGMVTAQETASSRQFDFKLDNPIIAQRVQEGQAVHADFQAGKASVEGVPGRFRIVSGPAPSSAPPAGSPPPRGAGVPTPSPVATAGKAPAKARAYPLPAVTAGAIEYVSQRGDGRASTRMRPGISQLRNADEIEQSDLPEAAKTMLLMHTLQLPRNSSDQYIVNKELAVEWANSKGKEVKADWRPKKKKPKKKKCDWQHVGNCVDKVAASAQDLWESGSDDWKRAWKANTKHLAESIDEAQECFADHTLPLGELPVKFNVTPQFPVSIEKRASNASASGTAQGTLTVGLPVEADFRARVELFYIPCLPFAIRPKSVGADGTMTVAAKLDARVLATGQFSEKYMIPPAGGPAIPIAVVPIVVGGVPVAILDVSLYVDGSVRVGGEGNLDGRFQLLAPYSSRYDFRCSGHGCSGRMKNVPVPTTTTENVVVKGSVFVQPAIYTALQLSLNFEALAGRAGPQPFLYGEVRGCSATEAMQSTSGQSTAQEYHALSADLDWGIEFRAEALVAGEQVTEYVTEVMKRKHLWFGDIAPGGSSAISPHVGGPPQLVSGQAGQFQLRSRPCYPYKETVEYSVTWTGGATTAQPAASRPVALREPAQRSGSSGNCSWGPGQGSCKLKPGEEASVSLAWPQPGSYVVTMTPLKDSHERQFKPERATRYSVTVQ